jgi:hypothetical protein
MNHRYILQTYHGRGSRFVCPNCRHSRHTFARYIDTRTNTYVADHVGICDRLDNCGYHYPPRAYFADSGYSGSGVVARGSGNLANTNHEPRFPNHNTMPFHYVTDTTKAYHRNNFIVFLTKCFDEATALRLAALYRIGTSKHWPGATIFWQIDLNDNVRTGKIMLYNPADGHRVKQPFNHITWAHTLVGKSESKSEKHIPDLRGLPDFPTKGFSLNQCFFGEHLLNTHPFKIVAIAESEKTAVICSFFYPEYIWLASGSLDGLTLPKCSVLKDRRVILYPDLNGYIKWSGKAKTLNFRLPKAKFTVDYTLEKSATAEERAQGLDMADRWLNQIINKKQ